jgi:tripartite-type tricarboxylate transporter receptor subunit TctC
MISRMTRASLGHGPKTALKKGINLVTLNAEINACLADPKMKGRFADLGASALVGAAADFGQLIVEETEKWGKLIRLANVRLD